MKGRIVDLVEHLRQQKVVGRADPVTGENGHLVSLPIPPVVPQRPRGAWDVDGMLVLVMPGADGPIHTVAEIAAYVEPRCGRWEVSIAREDWSHSVTLRGGYDPPHTPEQAIRTRAQIDLLRQIFAESFGIPA